MTVCQRILATAAAALAATAVHAESLSAEELLERVDVSHPLHGSKTFGLPRTRAFRQSDGSQLLVYQARYGDDGDHSENRLKLFRFHGGRGELLLDQNIDFVTFVERGHALRSITGKVVESLCDVCDGWDAAEPDDVFFVPIVIDVGPLKVRPVLSREERAKLLARLDARAARNVAEEAGHNEKYPAFASAVRARIKEALAGKAVGPPAAGRRGVWRLPTREELGDDWRRESEDRYAVARGDFDGDGTPDVARLMVSTAGGEVALVVSLSKLGEKVIPLEEPAGSVLGVMGIGVLHSGKHPTLCGKGAPCRPGEPPVLELAADAIDYFKTESASSVYYLPRGSTEFHRVWMSD